MNPVNERLGYRMERQTDGHIERQACEKDIFRERVRKRMEGQIERQAYPQIVPFSFRWIFFASSLISRSFSLWFLQFRVDEKQAKIYLLSLPGKPNLTLRFHFSLRNQKRRFTPIRICGTGRTISDSQRWLSSRPAYSEDLVALMAEREIKIYCSNC
jgi:hypothetical protein